MTSDHWNRNNRADEQLGEACDDGDRVCGDKQLPLSRCWAYDLETLAQKKMKPFRIRITDRNGNISYLERRRKL